MATSITDDQRNRMHILLREYGVRVERGISGFKILGLGNNTEPRAPTIDSVINLAESECKKIYGKYIES